MGMPTTSACYRRLDSSGAIFWTYTNGTWEREDYYCAAVVAVPLVFVYGGAAFAAVVLDFVWMYTRSWFVDNLRTMLLVAVRAGGGGCNIAGPLLPPRHYRGPAQTRAWCTDDQRNKRWDVHLTSLSSF